MAGRGGTILFLFACSIAHQLSACLPCLRREGHRHRGECACTGLDFSTSETLKLVVTEVRQALRLDLPAIRDALSITPGDAPGTHLDLSSRR